jgi:outer membrane protein OmpA-like peptidoglycan-associated protein/tetratricopeptide (TPR) repeat protein
MNLNKLALLTIVSGTIVSLSSCDQMKDLSYKVTPNPLEMHGDSVKISVVVNVPSKGLRKKAKAEITPKIGTVALATYTIQGEKVTGNGQTIPFKPGGTATFEQVVPYRPDMEAADLKLTGKVFKGAKEKEDIPETKLADGTIITPLMARKNFGLLTEDEINMVRETAKSTSAMINFEKAKSVVRPNEMKDQDVLDLMTWIKTAEQNPKIQITSVDIKGYASPDGVEDKNDKLSDERTRSSRNSIVDMFKKAKMNAWADTSKYILLGKGEDFEGFKEQLKVTTTIPEADKALFLRILEMTKDPVQREKDMVNLGKSYTELEKDVFPKIRRAVITINYKELGLTDDEIVAASKNNPSILSLEEMLFAASKTDDANEKARIFGAAIQSFPNDYRAYNNLGVIQYNQNKMADAKKNFEKANNLKDNASSKNNLAAISMQEGDRAQTRKLLNQAKTSDNKKSSVIATNSAALDILDGKYSSAERNVTGNTFNKALAQVLQNKMAEAKTTLQAEKEAADVHYLFAIIAARNGDSADAIVGHLNKAFALDSNFKTKAGKDREFVKFFSNSTFSSAVR